MVVQLRCKARKGAILRAAVGLDSAQVGLVPMGSVVEVVASEMLGAKERVSVVGAVDGTTGWGSRAMFESCPAAAAAPAATPRSALLNTGHSIPLLGFGTWKLPGSAETRALVRAAIRAGYRHFDTARMYSNEKQIGEAIAEAVAAGEVRREDLFVTTKLWNTDHGSKVEAACRASLARLGLDYVDLYLVHCPFTTVGPTLEPPLRETWKEMEKVAALGLARSVGVSNFSLKKIDALGGDVVPAVNQVELHPLLRQDALLAGCTARGIHCTAYSPLGSSDSASFMAHDGPSLLGHAVVRRVASDANCTPAQALLKFGVQRGCSVLPKSATPSRIQENADVFDAPLPPSAMDALAAVEPQRRFLHMKSCVNPKGPYRTLAEFWDEGE